MGHDSPFNEKWDLCFNLPRLRVILAMKNRAWHTEHGLNWSAPSGA
jgi:hypothetical protein